MDLIDLPLPFLLLLPFSVAAGVDLFLTLICLTFFHLLGGPDLFLTGLEPHEWGIAITLVGLYALEAVAELRSFSALFWHNLQLLLRPLGGGLLALALMDGMSPGITLLGVLVAGIVSAFTHVLTWGPKLILFLTGTRKVGVVFRTLAEDVLVLAFLVWSLDHPEPAFAFSGLLLIAGVGFGGNSHPAVRFGGFLLLDRVGSVFRSPRWRGEEELPAWISGAPNGPGTRTTGLRAAVLGLPPASGFRDGWILDVTGSYQFLFKKRGTGARVGLSPFGIDDGEEGTLARKVTLTGEDGRQAALFLQKNAPSLKSHKY